MQCERCQENEATIHLTQVIDGQVKKIHLCENCASESGFEVEGAMSVTDILLGMGGGAGAGSQVDTDFERSCPKCHMRRSDFKKSGQFGCPACYETFGEELAPLLKAMHRGERHVGKVPAREGMRVRVSAELSRLKTALADAVEGEQYEEAARLRDRIRECEARIGDGPIEEPK